jgi:hypothetical protein
MLLRSMLRRNQLLLFYELAGRLSSPPENHGVIGEKRVMAATTPDERAFLASLEVQYAKGRGGDLAFLPYLQSFSLASNINADQSRRRQHR